MLFASFNALNFLEILAREAKVQAADATFGRASPYLVTHLVADIHYDLSEHLTAHQVQAEADTHKAVAPCRCCMRALEVTAARRNIERAAQADADTHTTVAPCCCMRALEVIAARRNIEAAAEAIEPMAQIKPA